MKIGILGTGFGVYHASIYQKLASVDSIIIYGRNVEKLNKIKSDMNIEVTENLDDIMTNKDIDLIDICLPSFLHKEYVLKALKNGKHVFCETPISLNLEDALAMKEAKEQYKKRVLVNLFIKFEYPYQYVYKTLQKKTLGRLKALHIRRKTPPLWGDLSLDKIVSSLMIHEFDFITWLLGTPNTLSAAGINGKAEESHVDAMLVYADSIVEVHASSMMPQGYPFTVGYEAIFENGIIEYTDMGYENKQESSLTLYTYKEKELLEIPEKNCYEESMKHAISSIVKNTPSELELDNAIQALQVALQVKELLQKKGDN